MWLANLASFFIVMAIDDATRFHERAGSSLKVQAPSLPGVEALVEQYPLIPGSFSLVRFSQLWASTCGLFGKSWTSPGIGSG